MNRKQKRTLARIIAAAIITAALLIVSAVSDGLIPDGIPRLLLFAVPYLIIGYDILLGALDGIIHLRPFDESFLMAVATVGAFALGEYTEGVAVMLFYQIGELFQSCAVGKSRRSIGELMDIRPDYANLEHEDGTLEVVDPDDVEVGSVIIVNPGEKIPIDGVVIRGASSLDTRALTGESVPRGVTVGDTVAGGCINVSGVIAVRTEKPFGESTASRILELLEGASSKKSRSENFISKFARIYTPAVCGGALLLAVLPPVINLIAGNPANFSAWVYRALTFLVISCPCALVVSIPLTFFAAIGGAGSVGILIKGSNYMETLSRVRTVVFDKTGTMTKGTFSVTGIHHAKIDEAKLLEYAAHAEASSSHPISRSIISAYGRDIDRTRIGEVTEIGGEGIDAVVDGVHVLVGNSKLMASHGVEYQDCHSTGTVVHVAVDGHHVGHILISDELKPTSKEAVSNLRRARVDRLVMLTGDAESVGRAVAGELGVDDVHCELLPDGKVSIVENLLAAAEKGETLAFVGDGINDAPVLARADIGFAMGALGSDAAIEAADVVLMDDDPRRVADAILIARSCLSIVRENIVFAIGVKLACLILGALGLAGMWAAIFADVGVMVLAILNAIRALSVKKYTH